MQASLWPQAGVETLGPGAVILRGLAAHAETPLLEAIKQIEAASPFRHLTTPGGHVMSVAMTNAGSLGWTSDRSGYRYQPTDPLTGRAWPAIPDLILELAALAAEHAGFAYPVPDACLVNRYQPGSRLSLHQDRDEGRLAQPIVSFSLGLPATFLFGGGQRSDRTARSRLHSGDVVVFGGASRMAFHGVAPLAAGDHALAGPLRYNLTLRHAV